MKACWDTSHELCACKKFNVHLARTLRCNFCTCNDTWFFMYNFLECIQIQCIKFVKIQHDVIEITMCHYKVSLCYKFTSIYIYINSATCTLSVLCSDVRERWHRSENYVLMECNSVYMIFHGIVSRQGTPCLYCRWCGAGIRVSIIFK